MFSENETQSSQGSDKAPSEDNLDVEEIAEVIPIESDPDLMLKSANMLQSKVKEKQDDLKLALTDKTPVKRRVTLFPPKPRGVLPRTRTT